MSAKPTVSIVIPLYNEEESFPILVQRLNKLKKELPFKIEVVLIDDGSTDRTSELMEELSLSDSTYKSVFLSRNHGHQLALTAGLANVSATEAVMIIDGDLQDPPELLEQMYEKYKQGYDVVYAIRTKRKEDFFKRVSYWLFYRLLNLISNFNIPLDSGDFSLISMRVVNIMNKMPEESRYLRGMRSWIGFKQTGIVYERDERSYGETKYTLRKLIGLAYSGVFNFSDFPIKFITYLGLISILFSFLYLAFTIIHKLIYQNVPQGFTTTLFIIILLSGVQLVSLGVIGEYVTRIFFQVKNRPLYTISQIIENKKPKDG